MTSFTRAIPALLNSICATHVASSFFKTWNYYFEQSQPTTAGQEIDASGTGIIVEDMNTDAYAGDKMQIKVVYDTDGLNLTDWLAKISEEYPDYRMIPVAMVSNGFDISNKVYASQKLQEEGMHADYPFFVAEFTDADLDWVDFGLGLGFSLDNDFTPLHFG